MRSTEAKSHEVSWSAPIIIGELDEKGRRISLEANEADRNLDFGFARRGRPHRIGPPDASTRADWLRSARRLRRPIGFVRRGAGRIGLL